MSKPPAVQNRFVNALRVITSAVSLGHDETLIVHVAPAAATSTTLKPSNATGLAVGLEDSDDLVADIGAALDIALPA